ncbi:MAG: preprotein translocase subunit SecG [Rhodomicrobium sp.]
MFTVLLVVYIMVAFSMIVLILLQRSEGGALGMGGGGGGFVSGRGAATFLTRLTTVLAAIFFVTALTLGVFGHKQAPTSAVGGVSTPSSEAPAPAGAGEKAPVSLPALNLQKLKPQTPPAQSPAPAAPARPQPPQSQ